MARLLNSYRALWHKDLEGNYARPEEVKMWKFIHHTIAHPLRGITFDAKFAMRFHSWTADKAWPEHT